MSTQKRTIPVKHRANKNSKLLLGTNSKKLLKRSDANFWEKEIEKLKKN